MTRRLRVLLASERGYTLVELLAVMGILGSIMGGVTALLVSGTKAELDMNQRFQAQTQARLALDQLRREVHCATGVTESGTTAAIDGLAHYSTATLAISTACPTSGGQTQITWCTQPSGGSYRLWRYLGSSCGTGTGRFVAEHVTLQTPFDYVASSAASLAKLSVRIEVNVKPAQAQSTYKLNDDIVLRNSTRS